MHQNSKIYVAGHKGLVGSAIWKMLEQKGYGNLLGRTSTELDLTDSQAVASFFFDQKPEYVILAAAKVGGIIANNTYRGQFIYENLMIQNNVIHQAYLNGVKKLLFLGSTCIYPRNAPQPMSENSLLTSELEFTNEPYAIAKIAGIKMCESYNIQYGTNFISIMPTNLYGPNDNFNLETSHVLPALMRKIYLGKCLEIGNYQAIISDFEKRPVKGFNNQGDKDTLIQLLNNFGVGVDGCGNASVEIWGSGNPLREFLWSDDMASASVFVMENINFADLTNPLNEIRNTHINIGTGIEISIKHLAELIKSKTGFEGNLVFNTSKPNGTMRKLTDPSKIHQLGWRHTVEIEEGVERLLKWYLNS